MRKLLLGLLLGLLLIESSPALAITYKYQIPITVTENGTQSYGPIGLIATVNNTDLQARVLVNSTANNTAFTTGLHLPVSDRLAFAVTSVGQSSTNSYNYYLGSDTQTTSLPIIVGYGGYVTIADSANQELASNFTKTYTNLYLYGNGDIDTKGGSYNFIKSGTNVSFSIEQGQAYPVVANNVSGSQIGLDPWTVNMPSGVTAGDLLLVVVGNANGQTFSFPAGWTQLYTATNIARQDAWYKVSDGTEGVSISVDMSAAATGGYVSYRITGHGSSLSVSADNSGNNPNPDPPTVTPTWGSNKNLYIATETSQGSGMTASPAGYSNVINPHVALATAQLAATSASENPGAYTIGVAQLWVAKTIAVKPTNVSVTVTGVTDGLKSVVAVHADSVNLWTTIDSLSSANTTMVAVPNTASNIVLMSNATPYLGSYTLEVGGVQQVRYEPNAIISGTILPDRGSDGTNNAGVITWGANPANISVTMGAMQGLSSSTASNTVIGGSHLLPQAKISSPTESSPNGASAGDLYGFVKSISDATLIDITVVWYFVAIVGAIVLGVATMLVIGVIAGKYLPIQIIMGAGLVVIDIVLGVFSYGLGVIDHMVVIIGTVVCVGLYFALQQLSSGGRGTYYG